jgi:hypothetical protein
MRLLDDQVVHLVHRRCVRARAADDMTHVRRVVIVRAGAIDVYRRIAVTLGRQPGTLILYDRRTAPDQQRHPLERRLPHDPTILATRGSS